MLMHVAEAAAPRVAMLERVETAEMPELEDDDLAHDDEDSEEKGKTVRRVPQRSEIERPCDHNEWTKQTKKRGKLVLRCLVCNTMWKTYPEFHTKCPDFHTGHCPNGASCVHPHIYARRENKKKSESDNEEGDVSQDEATLAKLVVPGVRVPSELKAVVEKLAKKLAHGSQPGKASRKRHPPKAPPAPRQPPPPVPTSGVALVASLYCLKPAAPLARRTRRPAPRLTPPAVVSPLASSAGSKSSASPADSAGGGATREPAKKKLLLSSHANPITSTASGATFDTVLPKVSASAPVSPRASPGPLTPASFDANKATNQAPNRSHYGVYESSGGGYWGPDGSDAFGGGADLPLHLVSVKLSEALAYMTPEQQRSYEHSARAESEQTNSRPTAASASSDAPTPDGADPLHKMADAHLDSGYYSVLEAAGGYYPADYPPEYNQSWRHDPYAMFVM
ncbi:hypothetical protein DIPPA_32738 [Diplonema papillatum]|nr:hypothetical protein DIPPA_32738 [Diplonema papillatum]